ncbi:short-chain dehydrogenase [Paramesorhizobium deserti]|uniref:Short-chain dehydrogenase n=1 Tax=Paramesorhizobium deserti TaxID=1494590 RepID=A0A135HSF4_9HYPH|nr:NnrS family protein [Paramesorhizobium deserti]KXF76093.1 short-chain dehydrogenase [Paramesorhizobium deserti]
MPVPRIKPGRYPAILSYGFRPFFLLGALYAGLSILIWLPLLYGRLETASLFAPVDWHIHEMLFGYLAAIITGFLLTAIPNWTGRLPVQGMPLFVLVAIWLAGRFAVFFSAEIGWVVAAVVDCAFLLAVAAAAGVEIVAGRNWRNLKVLAPVAVLFMANILFHIEAHVNGLTDISRRLGIGAALVLIMIIGGRIIPSFTRNWLVRENPGRLPVPFARFDAVAIVISGATLAAWTFMPEQAVVGLALIAAGGLNLLRLARWAGDRTLRDPLVLVLHVAYIFVPTGFLLAGLAILFPEAVPAAAAIHAFGAGAIGSMTLAVMARATLGHTGRELHAGFGTCMIFLGVTLSAGLRIAAAFASDTAMLHASAALWAVAFLGYALLYGQALTMPRLRPRAAARA